MTRTTDRHLVRHLLLLGVAASAPVALGIAMHQEHEAMKRPATACEVAAVAVPTPIAIATPVAQAPEPEAAAALPIPLVYGETFAWVEHLGGPHVVLATDVDERWIGGSARVLDPESLRRPVDLDRLPDEIAARLGATVRAYSVDGEVCTGTIGAPFLHAAATDWETAIGEPEARTDRAEWLWIEGRRLLVAPLDGAGDCKGAIWARAADLAPPTFPTEIERPSKTQVQKARRGWLQTDPIRTASVDFDEWIVGTGTSQDEASGRRPRLRDRLTSSAWDLHEDGVDMVVLDLDGPELGGCGGFPNAWGLALVEEDGASVQRILHGRSGRVIGLVDVDGDGVSELLTGPREGWEGHELLRVDGDDLATVTTLADVPYFGCPC